jgi:hypothetical protein
MTQPKDSELSERRSRNRKSATPNAAETTAPPTRRPSRLGDSQRHELMGMGMTADEAEAWIRRI